MSSRAQGQPSPDLPKADRALRQLLEEPESGDQLVSAVVRLKPSAESQPALPPRETEETAQKVVERVSHRMGEDPAHLNVFRNLGAFSVCATASFLRELVSQPEIVAAVANRSSDAALAKPAPARTHRARQRRR